MQKGHKAYSSSNWSAILISHDALFALCIKLLSKVTDQPWRIICSLYKTLEQNFSSREFQGIFELKKSALRRTRKTSPVCLSRVLLKVLWKKTWFYLASQKRYILALSHLFWISLWVSWQNSWKNISKIVLSKVLPTSRCRDYALRFRWYMHIFYWIQYKF